MLEPRKPETFEKPARVYMPTLLPMALMYTVRNYEYSYGYTKEGQIYFDEYFPNALEILYRGKSAACTCAILKAPNQQKFPTKRSQTLPSRLSAKPSFRMPAKLCWSRNGWEPWSFIGTTNCRREC